MLFRIKLDCELEIVEEICRQMFNLAFRHHCIVWHLF